MGVPPIRAAGRSFTSEDVIVVELTRALGRGCLPAQLAAHARSRGCVEENLSCSTALAAENKQREGSRGGWRVPLAGLPDAARPGMKRSALQKMKQLRISRLNWCHPGRSCATPGGTGLVALPVRSPGRLGPPYPASSLHIRKRCPEADVAGTALAF